MTYPELVNAKVGDTATYLVHTDRLAGTIIKRTPKKITLQLDKPTLLNAPNSGQPDALNFSVGGFCGHTSGKQRWLHEKDSEGTCVEFSLRTNGRWKKVGTPAGSAGSVLLPGNQHYYDYNF